MKTLSKIAGRFLIVSSLIGASAGFATTAMANESERPVTKPVIGSVVPFEGVERTATAPRQHEQVERKYATAAARTKSLVPGDRSFGRLSAAATRLAIAANQG